MRSEAGTQRDPGDELYIMLQEGETKPLSEGKAEVHMAYTDVHFILEGEERIGYAPDSEGLEVVQDLRDNDALLFEKVPGETIIDLYKGDFLVLVPGEVHRTWGYTRASAPLRKLVVKLKL
ncbi:YhcH/YjgK/YiaL family protein [Paenibacillus sp. CC-CFT747]|nr:YhcH/YjgK/YiaL family protein [Paenibacillus sp. CC-CFT747]